MQFRTAFLVLLFGVFSCATESGVDDPLADYEEVDAATILDAPSAKPGQSSPENRFLADRGEYLVELLGCGSCHTHGALIGEPDMEKSLAGSRIGIAASNPLGDEHPGVVFAANITPDTETGIGLWSDQQIANALRAGLGRHLGKRIPVMPWQAYAKISDDDTAAIIAYLRSIEGIKHRVPDEIAPGQRTTESFVYFGVYRSR
ncbi:MAG: c-type cytochrome [Woeseiaceae bacterium]